jgi:hypothetical protein
MNFPQNQYDFALTKESSAATDSTEAVSKKAGITNVRRQVMRSLPSLSAYRLPRVIFYWDGRSNFNE